MTSNERYGRINKRHDARVRFLTRLGWTATHSDFGTMYVPPVRLWEGSRRRYIPATVIQLADATVWRDTLIRNLRRPGFC